MKAPISSAIGRLIVGRKQPLNFGQVPVDLPHCEADYCHDDNEAGQLRAPYSPPTPPHDGYLNSSTLGKPYTANRQRCARRRPNESPATSSEAALFQTRATH